jgi:hypothetical protein
MRVAELILQEKQKGEKHELRDQKSSEGSMGSDPAVARGFLVSLLPQKHRDCEALTD